ncbi:Type II/IV secretion system ATPase TadZ/CpaE, associated with Flp pilus assembly [hydrothermal vent metagenome]|uniref:Type II/IV secretion system ATPase TadZ/CpaE, associated with Flp pilus assembly n=1 Tax=hydrothermal vent metagenome TaxID=652676 RepID=A0A3B0TQF5_9ZZZZ
MTEPAFEFAPDDTPENGAGADMASAEVSMVPRITIQAFCETPATVSVMEEALADRRLVRAHFVVQAGGIAAAVEYYSSAPTPNLIIVESQAQSSLLVAELERLASVCDSGTNVLVVGHQNDIQLYRELMRQGVSDYLVAPFSVLQLIDIVGRIYANPDEGPLGRTVAFVGAKGGCGSSTIAHNVGWAISETMKENVVIADLDLAFGTLGLDFNQDPPQGIADALGSPERLDQMLLDRLLAKCTDRLHLFAAPSTLDREYDIDGEVLDQVIDLLRTSVPCVVLDLPHVWTGWARSTLLAADDVVITATPDLASLRNAKNIVDVLKANRSHDRPPYLVLNQVGMPKRPEIGIEDFTDALSLEPTLAIPFDPQLFGTSANNGQMIAEISNGAKIAQGFCDLAAGIVGRQQAKKQPKSLLAPLLSRFSSKKE